MVWIGHKDYFGAQSETDVAASGIERLRPGRKDEPTRLAASSSNPLREIT